MPSVNKPHSNQTALSKLHSKWTSQLITSRVTVSFNQSIDHKVALRWLYNDSQTGILSGIPESASCVQRFDDSRNSAIHITYRISLRSSSLQEPRDPLLKVVLLIIIHYESNDIKSIKCLVLKCLKITFRLVNEIQEHTRNQSKCTCITTVNITFNRS